MPTPAEHRALLFVTAVAVLGVGARGVAAWRRAEPPVADRAALARQVAAVDSALSAGGRRTGAGASSGRPPGQNASTPPRAAADRSTPPVRSASRGAAPGVGAIDMDVATVADLDRLPGIGPALAARIVADRDSLGPFGSLEGLQRVRGVGPALAARVQPYVTFRLPPRLNRTEVSAPGGVRHP